MFDYWLTRDHSSIVADRSLPPATVSAIRAAIDVRPWRSLEVDVGYALQQLRNLALSGLHGPTHDSATTDDALHYLGTVMGDLLANRDPTGALLGDHDCSLVVVGRQRNTDHVRDVCEPLVHAVGEHPLHREQLFGLLRLLRSAADGPSRAAGTPVKARLERLVEQLEGRKSI